MSMVVVSLTGQVTDWQSEKVRIPVYTGLGNNCTLTPGAGTKREKNPSVISVRLHYHSSNCIADGVSGC